MRCKLPYNENFVVPAKKHAYAGGNENLMINFAWPNVLYSITESLNCVIANFKQNMMITNPNLLSSWGLRPQAPAPGIY